MAARLEKLSANYSPVHIDPMVHTRLDNKWKKFKKKNNVILKLVLQCAAKKVISKVFSTIF